MSTCRWYGVIGPLVGRTVTLLSLLAMRMPGGLSTRAVSDSNVIRRALSNLSSHVLKKFGEKGQLHVKKDNYPDKKRGATF